MATKMTYGEQLKHPNWQRKRLEVLEAYDFTCGVCHSKEKTLHAHHKRYVKGRLAWEYDLGDLEAVCEDCHAAVHADRENLDEVVAQFPCMTLSILPALLTGFGLEYVKQPPAEGPHALGFLQGRVAWFSHFCLSDAEALEFSDLLVDLGPDRVMSALRQEARKDLPQ